LPLESGIFELIFISPNYILMWHLFLIDKSLMIDILPVEKDSKMLAFKLISIFQSFLFETVRTFSSQWLHLHSNSNFIPPAFSESEGSKFTIIIRRNSISLNPEKISEIYYRYGKFLSIHIINEISQIKLYYIIKNLQSGFEIF